MIEDLLLYTQPKDTHQIIPSTFSPFKTERVRSRFEVQRNLAPYETEYVLSGEVAIKFVASKVDLTSFEISLREARRSLRYEVYKPLFENLHRLEKAIGDHNRPLAFQYTAQLRALFLEGQTGNDEY